MTKINLREQYPDFYKTDYIIEVPDEVAAVMKEHDRLEAAYRRRTYYHKAHYSLDRGDGIEYDALFVSMTPCELYERKVTMEQASRCDCRSAGQAGQAHLCLLLPGTDRISDCQERRSQRCIGQRIYPARPSEHGDFP